MSQTFLPNQSQPYIKSITTSLIISLISKSFTIMKAVARLITGIWSLVSCDMAKNIYYYRGDVMVIL